MRQRSIDLFILVFSLGLSAGCTNLAGLDDELAKVDYVQGRLQYALDREQTEVRFNVGATKGRFRVADARLTFTDERVASGVLEVTLATAGLDVFNPLIEQMLKGDDWFAVERHPLALFATDRMRVIDVDTVEVSGNLTIKEVTQPLALSVQFDEGVPSLTAPPPTISFRATGAFLRSAYGMDDLQSMAPDRVDVEVAGVLRRLAQDERALMSP